MANNTPVQSHGDPGANEEAELTNDDGGNRNNNSPMSTTTTTGGITDAAGASRTLTIDPVDATLGNSGNVDNVAEPATDGTDGATSLSIGFGDVSTGETVPLVAENSSGRGDESGVVPGKDDAMSTAATESPSQAIGDDVPVSGDASNKATTPGKDGVNKKKSGGRKRKGAGETGETVPLVAENSSGRGDESGVVPGKDDAMSTAATESPSQAIGDDVPVSGDASNKATTPGKDGVNKKKSGGRKRKGADETVMQNTLHTISELTKESPRVRKQVQIYSPPVEKKTRRQPTSPSKPGNTGADASLSKAASNEASEDESEEESEEKSKAPSDIDYNMLFDEDTSISSKTPSVSAIDLQEELANLANDVPQQVPIDVDEEDIAVPFDPTQFAEKDNIEQKLILASSTCVFNIHFLPLSVLVHSTEQYLFCKSARRYLEFFNILDIFQTHLFFLCCSVVCNFSTLLIFSKRMTFFLFLRSTVGESSKSVLD